MLDYKSLSMSSFPIRVLLTGASGQVGRCVQDRVKMMDRAGQYELIALDRGGLDITNLMLVEDVLCRFQPQIVINAAAYTAVDRAEQEPGAANAANVEAPKNLALVCGKLGIPLIHISTDYVFDGSNSIPYHEEMPTSPLGVYGCSKLAGEEAVREHLSEHLILRTSWVFSEYGNNFVKTMLRLGQERDQLGIVSDQFGCPTYAGHIAEIILQFVDAIENRGFSSWGTYHLCGDKMVSWFEFAQAIFAAASESMLLSNSPKLNPISTADYPTPATRPAFSVLDNKKLMDTLDNEVVRDWHLGLSIVLEKLTRS